MKTQGQQAPRRTFGRYEIIRKIAKGGMAEVYLAKSRGAEGVEKRLVIKTILPEFAQNPRFTAMFVEEARIAMSLNHPNIVQTYDFGYEDGIYFIAMEYVEGYDLATILSLLPQGVILPLGEALYICIEVCRGLDYAHRRQDVSGNPLHIVHCDISPHNTMVSLDGVIQIVDFGISRAVRNMFGETGQMPMGKYQYMSPEQALDSPVDERADIFSTSAVLYELLANRPLYDYKTYAEVYNAARAGALPDFNLIQPSIPFELKFVLDKGLDRIASRRFQGIRDLQLELYKILKTLPGVHDGQTLSHFLQQNIADSSYSSLILSAPSSVKSPLSSFPASLSGSLPVQTVHKRSGSQLWDDVGVDELFAWVDVENIEIPELERPQEAGFVSKKVAIAISGTLKATVAGVDLFGSQTESWQSKVHQMLDHLVYKNNAWLQSFDERGFVIVIGAHLMSVGDAQRAVMLAYDILEASASLWAQSGVSGQYAVCISQVEVLLRQEASLSRPRKAILEQAQRDFALSCALLGKAGEILVTSKTYYRIVNYYEVESAAQFERNNETIALYRILGAKSARESQSSALSSYQKLFGRDLQLKELHDALMQVQVLGKSQAICFEGIPGVGKSVIVEEFLRSLQADPNEQSAHDSKLYIYRALGLLRTQSLPYSTLRALFLDLLKVDVLASPQQILQSAQQRLYKRFGIEDADLQQRIGLLFEQLMLDYPDEGAYTAIEARQNALALSAILMRAMPEDAVNIFFIDDMQYVDVASIDYFTQLYLNAPRPILLIVTSTPMDSAASSAADCLEDSFISNNKVNELYHLSLLPEAKRHSSSSASAKDEHRIWQMFLSLPNLHRETIHSLNTQDAKALLSEQLANLPIDDELVEGILSRAAGIPFFIVQIVEALREREALSYVDGRYTLSAQAIEQWAPASIVSIVGEAVDRLPEYLRDHLRLISILGREFNLDDAIFLFGNSIQGPVEELVQRGWLKELSHTKDPAQVVYVFTQQIAYELLDYSNQNADFEPLQRKLADYYAAKREQGRDISYNTIARHYVRGKSYELALEYYVRSARYLRTTLIPTEAVRVGAEGLKVLAFIPEPNAELVYELLSVQDWAYLELGEHENHTLTSQRLRELAVKSKNPKLLAQTTVSLAGNYFYLGNYVQTRTILQKLIAQIHTNTDLVEELVKAFYFYSTTLCYMGKAEESIFFVDRFLEEHKGNIQRINKCEIAKLLKSKADAMCYLAEYENAASCIEMAMREDCCTSTALMMRLSLAYCHIEMGRFDLVPYDALLEECSPKSAVVLRKHVGSLLLLAYYNLRVGNYEQAEAQLNRAVKMSRHFRMLQGESFAWLLALRTQIEQKYFKKAFKMLPIAEKSVQKSDNIYLLSQLRLIRAEIALFDKKNFYSPEVALKHAMAAVSIGQSTSYPLPFIRGYHLAALAYEALDQNETAVKMARSLAPHLIRHRIEFTDIMLYAQAQLLRKHDPHSATLAQQLLQQAHQIVAKTLEHIPTQEQKNFYLQRNTIERILNYSPTPS